MTPLESRFWAKVQRGGLHKQDWARIFVGNNVDDCSLKDLCFDLTRAVLSALIPPDEGMIEAGAQVCRAYDPDFGRSEPIDSYVENAADIFTAMINAAREG